MSILYTNDRHRMLFEISAPGTLVSFIIIIVSELLSVENHDDVAYWLMIDEQFP